mgnify:CR=1 FL=1
MVEVLNKRNFRQIAIVFVNNDEKKTGKLEKIFQSDYSTALARIELKIKYRKKNKNKKISNSTYESKKFKIFLS